MAWAYCDGCGNQLGMPTYKETADDDYVCRCGVKNDPRRTVGDVLDDINDRLMELERKAMD